MTNETQLDAVKRLAEKHFRRKRGILADRAGIPRNTVQKILMGYTRQPLSGTLQKLYDVCLQAEREEQEPNKVSAGEGKSADETVGEQSA